MIATAPDQAPALDHRPMRLFTVSYAWRRYGKEFRATTVWAARSRDDAQADFARRNPHVISFTILEERQ